MATSVSVRLAILGMNVNMVQLTLPVVISILIWTHFVLITVFYNSLFYHYLMCVNISCKSL